MSLTDDYSVVERSDVKRPIGSSHFLYDVWAVNHRRGRVFGPRGLTDRRPRRRRQ